MATNIKIFNSYLKGFKTIKGNFPVFISSSVLNCETLKTNQVFNVEDENIKEDLYDILMTSDSNQHNQNIILFDVYDNGDYYFINL
jgi:hypothetical protein